MKKHMIARPVFAGALLFAFQFLQAQNGFVINGQFQPDKKGYIHVQYNNGVKQVRDSAQLVNGRFTLKGNLRNPALAALRYSPAVEDGPLTYAVQKSRNYKIFLDTGVSVSLEAKDALSAAVVKGSRLQEEYLDYSKKITEIYLKMQPVNMAIHRLERERKYDSAAVYKEKLKLLDKEEEQFLHALIEADPASPVALLAVYEFDRPGAMVSKPTRPFFEKLSPELRGMPMGLDLEKKLAERDMFGAGKKVLDFQLPDTLGRMVDFASLKGTYVLLDFWASWCGPCRAQHPFLREAYQRFKDAGFNIVSVSVDNSRDNWLAAIRKDGVGDWIHVSDLKGMKGELPGKYRINGIPHNFLIDMRTRTIVGTDLFGAELDKKLNALLIHP